MYSRKGERGSVTLLYTLSITAMAGMVGMVVDIGWAYFQEGVVQAAAESAALAAVSAASSNSAGGITCNSGQVACQAATACPQNITTPANNLQNGCLYAKDNGVQAGAANQNIYMAANTTSSPVSGLATQYWVSATAVRTTPLTFLSVIGQGAGVISKTATAALVPGIQGDCIYVLSKTAANALTVTGNGNLTSGCGIWVNSSDSKAIQVKGNGTLRVTSGNIAMDGGDTGSNGTCTSQTATGCVSPAPTTITNQFSDPLASLAAPSWSGCDHSSQVSVSGGTPTLSPGVYCGGISLTGGTVTFSPGVYVLDGGGLKISGNGTINGSGVMFYNTGDGTHPFSAIAIAGGPTVTLSAPTSGTYANVLFFQDRSKGSSSDVNSFAGGASLQLTGVLYFEPSSVTYAGGSSGSSPSAAIVSDTLTITGTGYLQNGISGNGGTGTKTSIIF